MSDEEGNKSLTQSGLTVEEVEQFKNAAYSICNGILTVEEYRKLANDYVSTDEEIQKRLEFLIVLCRNIISLELKNLKI